MRRLLLIGLSPAAIILAFDILFYYRPILSNGCFGICDGPIYFMLVTDLIAAVYFFYAASKILFGRRASRDFNGGRSVLAVKWYFVSMFLVIALYEFLVFQVFAGFNPVLVFENYDEFYSMSGTGTAWVFLIFNVICFLLLYDMYMGAGGAFKTWIFLTILLVVAATGGRSIVVVLILFSIFLHVVINKKTVSGVVIAIASILMLTVFFGNAFLRSGGVDAYSGEATKLDFDNSFILSDVVDYVDVNGPNYFVAADDFYYFFIPRALDEFKPLSTAETRAVYPEVAERGTSYTFGLYGNLYLNFGYIGLPLAPFLVFILNFVYFRIYLSEKREPYLFLVLFLVFYTIQFVRGGVINSRFMLFVISISIACLIWRFLSSMVYDARFSKKFPLSKVIQS